MLKVIGVQNVQLVVVLRQKRHYTFTQTSFCPVRESDEVLANATILLLSVLLLFTTVISAETKDELSSLTMAYKCKQQSVSHA